MKIESKVFFEWFSISLIVQSSVKLEKRFPISEGLSVCDEFTSCLSSFCVTCLFCWELLALETVLRYKDMYFMFPIRMGRNHFLVCIFFLSFIELLQAMISRRIFSKFTQRFVALLRLFKLTQLQMCVTFLGDSLYRGFKLILLLQISA